MNECEGIERYLSDARRCPYVLPRARKLRNRTNHSQDMQLIGAGKTNCVSQFLSLQVVAVEVLSKEY